MKNEDTFNYLTGLGFKYRESIYRNEKAYAFYDLEGVLTLKLPKMAKVDDIFRLVEKINNQSFEAGIAHGKDLATIAISGKLREIVTSTT